MKERNNLPKERIKKTNLLEQNRVSCACLCNDRSNGLVFYPKTKKELKIIGTLFKLKNLSFICPQLTLISAEK